MGGCLYNFSKEWKSHRFLTHKINIFTAAIVIDVVQAMRIGEARFVHPQIFSFVVHVVHKLDIVKSHTFVVLGKVDTSNF